MRISIVNKILMSLLFASLISGLSAGPALARNGDKGYERPGQRGYQVNRGWHGERGRTVYRPRGYYRPGPSYYAPPIYTVPAPSPGISLFLPFPFDIR